VCQAFLINVLKNQGSVECVGTRGEAVKAIGQYLYAHFRSHRLVAGNDPRLAAMPWRDAGVLPRFGSLETGEPAALSFAQLGVVETGAVVTWTGRANPAANNLLPEHHIVLVDAADLVPTMEKAWERINQEMEKIGRPRGINFIAGPSSTADIEGQLVYGAHGPRCWHVILLGKVPSDALELARASLARP
jgi:L-lactate dehydrogenase complex protein LldG